MASIYQLKPTFQSLLRPMVHSLAKYGVTANQITLFACLLSILYGFALIIGENLRLLYLFLPLFLFFRMALNAIDGMLAREHNMKSQLGTYLNELCDVLSDTALYYPLLITAQVNLHLVILFISLSIISEMAGIIAVQIGKERRYDGPLGKSDRAFLLSLLALLLGFQVPIDSFLDIGISVLILLLLLTTINRCRKGLKGV